MELRSNAVASRPSPSEHVCPVPPASVSMDRVNKAWCITQDLRNFSSCTSHRGSQTRKVWSGKLRLGRPVAGEVGWGGRETARRYFTGVNDCEFFEVEFGISEGIDFTDGSLPRHAGRARPGLNRVNRGLPLSC